MLSIFSSNRLKIQGSDLILKRPDMRDFSNWQKTRRESTGFLQKWEPKWSDDDLTQTGFRRRLNTYHLQWKRRSARTYLLKHGSSGEVYGGLSLTRIDRDYSNSALLGYWMGARHAGNGHMQKAVKRILQSAFGDLGLKRVEAACLPMNACSIHLLEKLGFTRQGYEQDFLEINGRSEDHILFTITGPKGH